MLACRGIDQPYRDSDLLPSLARGHNAAGQRRFTNHLVGPQFIEQLIFGNDPVPMMKEVHQHIEHLGLDIDGFALPTELVEVVVKVTVTEGVNHDSAPKRERSLRGQP